MMIFVYLYVPIIADIENGLQLLHDVQNTNNELKLWSWMLLEKQPTNSIRSLNC